MGNTRLTRAGFDKDHNLVVCMGGEPRKVQTQFGLGRDGKFLLMTNFGVVKADMPKVREHLDAIVKRGSFEVLTCYAGYIGESEEFEPIDDAVVFEISPPFNHRDHIEDPQFIATLRQILEMWDKQFGSG